jgi:DNA gyrase/topoisomerase IV subunit A
VSLDGDAYEPRAWLATREAQLAALEQYETVLAPLHNLDREVDARAAVTAALGCGSEQAGQVLELQLRRLACRERAHLTDEIRGLIGPQEEPDRIPSPPEPTVPAGAAFRVSRTRAATPPQPMSAAEQTRRRSRWEGDRRLALQAIAAVAANPRDVLTMVHGAADVPAASELLIERYGWSREQAVAVLDMQFRSLLGANRRVISAELGVDC